MTLLDIAVFAASDARWDNKLDYYVDGANYHLANFDLRLNVFPLRGQPPVMLPAAGLVHDRPPDFGFAVLPGDVRLGASVALPQAHGIPVIFCRFSRSSDAGLTVYSDDAGANRHVAWLNYILVNGDVLNFQPNVILHELIHAANYQGDADRWHDGDPTSIMHASANPALGISMRAAHADALRRSYFARTV